jgi:hypothetical protein
MVSLHGVTLSLHCSMVMCLYGSMVSLHCATVRLHGVMVSLQGVMVSLYGAMVSLHGATVSLHSATVSLRGSIYFYIQRQTKITECGAPDLCTICEMFSKITPNNFILKCFLFNLYKVRQMKIFKKNTIL